MRFSLCIPRIKYAALHRARPSRPWRIMAILTHLAETQVDMVTQLSPRMCKRALPAPWRDTPHPRATWSTWVHHQPQRSARRAPALSARGLCAQGHGHLGCQADSLACSSASAAVWVPPSPHTRGKSTLTLRVWIRIRAVADALLQLLVAQAETKCFVWFKG